MYEYKAKIVKVYDGDTVTALVDLGFKVQFEIKVRLYGINTPEIRGIDKEKGLIAKERLVELVLDKEVTLKTFKDKTGKYGRYLAEIFVESDLQSYYTNVNQVLLDEGLAESYIK